MDEYLVNITFIKCDCKKGHCDIRPYFDRKWYKWDEYIHKHLLNMVEPFVIQFPFND